MKTRLPTPSKEKGQSLVELAMVFTLLLFFTTGIVDIGSMYYTYTALQDTVQEGAIYGALHPTQPNLIANHIKELANYPVDTANLTDITVTCSGVACVPTNIFSCQGQNIKLEVGYNYKLIMPILPEVLGRNFITMKASVISTILQSPDTIAALSELATPQSCP